MVARPRLQKIGDGLGRLAYPDEGAVARYEERVLVQSSYWCGGARRTWSRVAHSVPRLCGHATAAGRD
jgi:hypothetical protein